MSDTLWLTYAELAERLDITGDSARNLVRRRGWPRKPGNDGTQRIGIPKEYLDERATDEATPAPPIMVPIIPPPEVDLTEAIEGATVAALEGHIETLKEIVDRERERTAEERARADRERDRADAERDKAEAAAAKLAVVRANSAEQAAGFERNMAELRTLVDGLQRPWWRRLARG